MHVTWKNSCKCQLLMEKKAAESEKGRDVVAEIVDDFVEAVGEG